MTRKQANPTQVIYQVGPMRVTLDLPQRKATIPMERAYQWHPEDLYRLARLARTLT